jgi:hypothetical protein
MTTTKATRINVTAHNFYYLHQECAADANIGAATKTAVKTAAGKVCRFCGNEIK